MSKWKDWKFFKWGTFGNTWLWFHMGASALGSRIGIEFFDNLLVTIVMVFLIFLWEVIEFAAGGGKVGMIKIYGSLERWFYDSLGDVVWAIYMIILVIY